MGGAGHLSLETLMKPLLIATTLAALVAVAACNSESGSSPSKGALPGPGPENTAVPTNTAVPDAATGNMVANPSGPVTAEAAYEIRHERYEEMGDSLKAINRELKGGAPDVARIQREAATLASLAEQIPTWFPAGSGPDVHAKSRAKAEIWSDAQGFAEAHKGFAQQAQNFKRVADSGDVNQIRAAVQPFGKSCGDCHDKFRGPER